MNIPKTRHEILIGAADKKMEAINDNSVGLVVTSPPYPMIEMWDEIMGKQNVQISDALRSGNGSLAFEQMHIELDKTWAQTARVLKPGGFACINIGDATRTIDEQFALYNNHSRIISAFLKLGFTNMPNIIWRKQTNAPNKFMGSGMLPAGAYVTLEHEWVLVFRKGGKRVFKTDDEKQLRRESSFFWEERNTWFSDLWDLKGTRQKLESTESRSRSAAYPFELPYRLINMYSVKGDIILDPFLGTGTTTLAAIASERNSVGIEIDPALLPKIENNIFHIAPAALNKYIANRVEQHKLFLTARISDITKKDIKHFNQQLNLPVMTSQETGIRFSLVDEISNQESVCTVSYIAAAQSDALTLTKSDKSVQEVISFS